MLRRKFMRSLQMLQCRIMHAFFFGSTVLCVLRGSIIRSNTQRGSSAFGAGPPSLTCACAVFRDTCLSLTANFSLLWRPFWTLHGTCCTTAPSSTLRSSSHLIAFPSLLELFLVALIHQAHLLSTFNTVVYACLSFCLAGLWVCQPFVRR
jgi:hypothetical protein